MKRGIMFTTTETAAEEPVEKRPERRKQTQAPAAGTPDALARLTDPAWLAATLWNRKGLIILSALLGLVLAGLASLMLPPKYISTAQLFIDPRDLRVLQNEVSPNAVSGDPTSITGYLESQARVIASDSIKSRVVESEGLDKDPEFGGEASKSGLMRILSEFLPSSGAPAHEGMLYALAALDKSVAVRRGERTFVIDISVTSKEAAKAARIANALANAYLDDQASVRADAAQRATGALTGRLEELRNRLRTAEDKAEKYKEANNIVGFGGKSMTEEQLALNNAQLVALRTRATEAKAKYDQTLATRAASIEAGAVPEAVASNTMTALRSQLGAALNKEADLLASLGARHPALASAQAQVRDARRQIAEELARIGRAAKVEYDRAVEAERQISQRVDQLTKTQYAASRASVELRELEREVESSRVVYDAFLRRARETGELAGIDTTNARIISQAMPPLEKSGITRRTIAMLGGIGGGGVGAMLAIGLALMAGGPLPAPAAQPAAGFSLWRRRTRLPAQAEPDAPAVEASPPEDLAPAPVPDTIPAAPAPQPAGAKTGWRRFTTIQGGQAERLPEIVQATAAPLLATLPAVRHRRWRRNEDEPRSVFQSKAHLVDVLDKPNAAFAKAIRTAGMALAKEGAPSARRRVLVLGLRSNAGASTLALNLALDAAQEGLPALLVDAGLGENSLTKVFAGEAQTGLHEIATGAAGLVRAALQDEGTGLFFLPRVGRVDLVTAEQISDGFFAAARRFGPIVIDGAALGSDALSQRFADAVDDIILVIRKGEVAAGDLAQANDALGPNAAKIRGFVVNEA
ncbi:uncharacterized protein involved in exopolysaccharide biosynthesis/Mrp family chromosome partitioning ATPase [Bosea sp. BE125]|uniref:exopolysaccharide transport family protein n=1 Tax=Bosea sp. BE125 TaxID=2817909 RepID=UPI00285F37F0|nr:exopolysaccharide transport family protein [Bosea sp. BE125]MDR6872415.1 uncharacterized protein involved in exopolysaccharide biosynthesis/Mrp family chromosome partitioning ATPase [Bosea sp. BE125]